MKTTKKITIENNPNEGENKIISNFFVLSNFVEENIEKLITGAYRRDDANVYYEMDFESATEIVIGSLIIHDGYSITNIQDWNWSYDSVETLTEENIIYASEKIQKLIDAAENEVPCSFEIKIIEK